MIGLTNIKEGHLSDVIFQLDEEATLPASYGILIEPCPGNIVQFTTMEVYADYLAVLLVSCQELSF